MKDKIYNQYIIDGHALTTSKEVEDLLKDRALRELGYAFAKDNYKTERVEHEYFYGSKLKTFDSYEDALKSARSETPPVGEAYVNKRVTITIDSITKDELDLRLSIRDSHTIHDVLNDVNIVLRSTTGHDYHHYQTIYREKF